MNAKIDISNVTIRTERLTLRPWTSKDLDDLYEYASADGVGQSAGWLPHKSKDESRDILQRFINEKKTFAIQFDGKAIGSIGIELYDEKKLPEFDEKQGREIGYVLSKDYWGMGIMPEAVKAVIQYLFEVLNLDFIVCGHFADNIRSMRVQEKCGFKHYIQTKITTQYGEIKDGWISVLER